MANVKVGVAGYGVIGQRVGGRRSRQGDMELVGVADIAPYDIGAGAQRKGHALQDVQCGSPATRAMEEAGIPVSGSFEELVQEVDIMLDSSPGGIGAKNKELYQKLGKKAVFQGGEKNSVADVFFHGYANYEKGIGQDYLKLTSCNTTGLIRAVDMLDRAVGVEKVAITIIRRVADPGRLSPRPHERFEGGGGAEPSGGGPHDDHAACAVHRHSRSYAGDARPHHHGGGHAQEGHSARSSCGRWRMNIPESNPVRLADGFLGNASLFRWARDMGYPRGDMYEIALWEESIVKSGDDIMFAINIPQESVVIPENIDAIRAAMKMQLTREEGTAETNKYLGMK